MCHSGRVVAGQRARVRGKGPLMEAEDRKCRTGNSRQQALCFLVMAIGQGPLSRRHLDFLLTREGGRERSRLVLCSFVAMSTEVGPAVNVWFGWTGAGSR